MLRINSEVWAGDIEIPPFETLLLKFHPGISRSAHVNKLDLHEVRSEATLAYVDAVFGFDPKRGDFSRRWWFLLDKRLKKLSPKPADALSHIDSTIDDLENKIADEEE